MDSDLENGSSCGSFSEGENDEEKQEDSSTKLRIRVLRKRGKLYWRLRRIFPPRLVTASLAILGLLLSILQLCFHSNAYISIIFGFMCFVPLLIAGVSFVASTCKRKRGKCEKCRSFCALGGQCSFSCVFICSCLDVLLNLIIGITLLRQGSLGTFLFTMTICVSCGCFFFCVFPSFLTGCINCYYLYPPPTKMVTVKKSANEPQEEEEDSFNGLEENEGEADESVDDSISSSGEVNYPRTRSSSDDDDDDEDVIQHKDIWEQSREGGDFYFSHTQQYIPRVRLCVFCHHPNHRGEENSDCKHTTCTECQFHFCQICLGANYDQLLFGNEPLFEDILRIGVSDRRIYDCGGPHDTCRRSNPQGGGEEAFIFETQTRGNISSWSKKPKRDLWLASKGNRLNNYNCNVVLENSEDEDDEHAL